MKNVLIWIGIFNILHCGLCQKQNPLDTEAKVKTVIKSLGVLKL
jgi:hypothetical protein